MEKDAIYGVADLGGTRVRTALADSSAQLINRIEAPTDHSCGPEGTVEQIARLLATSRQDIAAAPRSLVIAAPGPARPSNGVVYSPSNMPGWGEVPLKDLLEAATGLPTLVVNDASAAGFGEFTFGSGRGHRNLVYLTVSTGIGGGAVIDGKLLLGTSGAAMEIGHMTIDRHGPICNCGSVGCLEMLASGTSIARRFQEALDAGGESAVTARPATARDVAAGAAAGDPLAGAVFRDAAEAIGTGVVNCLHIFNPDIVALGGGVTLAGPLLFDPIRRIVARYALSVAREDAQVVPAMLGEDMGLRGAAAIAREEGTAWYT